MSLYDEGVELDRMYQNCRADVEALQERVQELEQLVSDAQGLMEKYHGTIESMSGLPYAVRAPILPEIEAWQHRAKAALHEGEVEPLQQEGES